MKMKVSDRRFWQKVVMTPSNDDCWEWIGYRKSFGHGWLTREKTQHSAHRWSWYLYTGKMPGKAHVIHGCDNPPCVNPHHLRLGGYEENVQDKMDRGRHHSGHITPTLDQMIQVHHLRGKGLSCAHIGSRFGWNMQRVRKLLKGQTYPKLQREYKEWEKKHAKQ